MAKTDPELVLHRFIEASKFAYAARSDLGDLTFNATALKIAKQIISAEYAAKIRSLSDIFCNVWSPISDTFSLFFEAFSVCKFQEVNH